MDEYLAARRECGLCNASLAHQSLCAGNNFVTASFQRNAHQECRNRSQRNTNGESGEQVNAHLRNGRINQQQSTERKQNDAANREYAVAGKFRFSSEKCECSQNEHQRREAGWQKIESKGRDQNKNHAHGSGNYRAGMIEFRIESQGADGQKNEGNVRVHQMAEDAFFERHAEQRDRLAGKSESAFLAVETLETFPRHLAEEILLVGSNVVDEMLRKSFLLGKGFGLAYRALCALDVAA